MLGVIGVAAAPGETGAVAVAPGTAAMAERLERISRGLNPMNVPFLNRERASVMSRLLESDPSNRTNAPFRAQYATELLNAGFPEKALAEFDSIAPLADLMSPRERLGFLGKVDIMRSISFLRLGEVENCLADHVANACLIPFQPDALHRLPRGSRNAISVLTSLLGREPNNMEARWLLNLANMTLGMYPEGVPVPYRMDPGALRSDAPFPRFTNAARAAGIDLLGLAGGVVADDLDNDGDIDLMISQWGIRDPLHYFENLGDGTFADRSDRLGLPGIVGGLNMVQADYDNDGLVDILILRGAWMKSSGRYPNSLLRNLGGGRFEDVTEKAGILSLHPTQAAVWFDFDNDGWLDLFIGNETTEGSIHPCELYRNNRDGTFTSCAAESGVAYRLWVKGVAAGDYDNDGRTDLYLSCLGQPNVLLHNDGPDPGDSKGLRWRFRDVTPEAGVQEPLFSFPTWFFDYDNDGLLDLFVSGYRVKTAGDVYADMVGSPTDGARARLYRNLGNGRFDDVSVEAGVSKVLLTMGSNFGDLDNDGWPDFYLATGNPDVGMVVPNRMFRNDRGRRFQDVTSAGGFGHLQKGHAVAFVDLDEDGDEDVFNCIGGAFAGDVARNVLFENPGTTNHWVGLRLEGTKSNRSAIGARIRVTLPADLTGKGRSVYKTVGSGGSFGAGPLRQHIGVAGATNVAIEVWWPTTGVRERFETVQADRWYQLREGSGTLAPLASKPVRLGGGARSPR